MGSADVVVQFVRMRPQAVAPVRMTAAAAGYDLTACLDDGQDGRPGEPITLAPRARVRVPTGLRIAIPVGYEGQVRPRSGWADRAGVTVLNAPGTIDADYRGELMVLLVNLGTDTVNIRHGDRIAQLVIAPVVSTAFVESSELPDPAIASPGAGGANVRGEGGFGSTDLPRATPTTSVDDPQT